MKLDTLRQAIEAACDVFERGDDSTVPAVGDLLHARMRAALRGSDWRYVKSLGGTLTREV